MSKIKIFVGTTWVKLATDRWGVIDRTTSLHEFIREHLRQSEWNPKLRCFITQYNYTHYDLIEGMAYLPRYCLPELISYLGGPRVEVEYVEPNEVHTPLAKRIKIKDKFQPRDYQTPMIEFLSKPDVNFSPLSAQCGDGKELPVSAPVLTPIGWINVGDIVLGDEVTAWDGTTTLVIGVYDQGVKDIYQVTLTDGRTAEAGAEHLWTVSLFDDEQGDFNRFQSFVISTIGIRRLLARGFRLALPKFEGSWELWDEISEVSGVLRQEECVCIAVEHPDHLYVTRDYIVTHNTFCSIYSAVHVGGPILIVLGLLITQWYKSLREYTTMKKDDIFVVQGFDKLKMLWEMIDNGFKPAVVIFSTRTLFLYAITRPEPYNHLRTYQELQQKIGFATKIFDECHLNFFANVKIDMLSNIKKNIYLSATYMRSDPQGKRIFNTVYPPQMRYGEDRVTKYTAVIVVAYSLHFQSNMDYRFKREKGYLHALYESYLLKHKGYYFTMFIHNVLLKVIHDYFTLKRSDKQKLLIICKTKVFCEAVAQFLKPELKQYKISVYFSGNPGKEGKQENLQSDIIVSTTNSCSTGIDIKGLKTCINTVSFSSPPMALQIMGRLREIKGETTYFVDIANEQVYNQRDYQAKRKSLYRNRAKSVKEITLNV